MSSQDRRGSSPVEVVVGLVVVLLVIAVVMMALPRNRENARLASCRKNLMLIGQALAYYDGASGHLPTASAFGHSGTPALPTMLGQLGLGDLSALSNPKWKPTGRPLTTVPEHVVGDFLCPSDPNFRSSGFPAPVSYRVNTGGNTDGTGGPFAPGTVVSMADVEKGDGNDFTAGFAERLLGSGLAAEPSDRNDYVLVPGTVNEASGTGGIWRTNAGASWTNPGWSATLYNHAIRPGSTQSAISQDGRTARMGASSGHSNVVQVLMLSGSVRSFTPTVDAEVWRRFGNINDPVASVTEP